MIDLYNSTSMFKYLKEVYKNKNSQFINYITLYVVIL